MTGSTGRRSLREGVDAAAHARKDGWVEEGAVARAAGEDRGAVGDRLPHLRLDTAGRALGDQRTDVRFASRGSPSRKRRGPRDELATRRP